LREHEAKLSIEADSELPDLGVPTAAVCGEILAPRQRTITDVYYDTADLRLLRWGCTLRHRRRSGWTVKLPIGSTDESLTRDEVDLGGRAGKPPPEALRLVMSFSRGQPLTVIATITTQRTIRPVRSREGRALVEVADDLVSSVTVDGVATTFRQVEVELAPDADPSILGPIVQALTDAGARPEPEGIKLAIALGRPPLEPDVVVPDLPKRPSARHVIHRAIARSVTQLLVQLPLARLGDPEAVHQARVATRRLRSDLRTCRPLLDRAGAAELFPGLRDLAAHLGRVRDADVLHQLLRTTLAAHPEIDASAGDEVLARLGHRRERALAALDTHLDRPETHRLLDDLVRASADPPTTAGADGPARQQLAHLVHGRWRRLRRAVRDLGPAPSPEALHEVRILAKRARYATDAVAPVFGSATRRFAASLGALQDALGDRNDADVADRWLRDHATGLTPPAAFAAGRLAQALHDTAAIDDRWRARWETVQGRRPGWLADPGHRATAETEG
jgi:CHAD domain-containing protein